MKLSRRCRLLCLFAVAWLAAATYAQPPTAMVEDEASNNASLATSPSPAQQLPSDNEAVSVTTVAAGETVSVLNSSPEDSSDIISPEESAENDAAGSLTTKTSTTQAPVLPHDLSAWGMFMQADWVVKAVMIGLILASFATLTVLVAKTRELRMLVKRQQHTLTTVSEAQTLKAAHHQLTETQGDAELTLAAAKELKLSTATLADAEGVKERVASSLQRLEAANGRKVTRGTSILATIGSTAPFVGLFGTVWGIMNSFIGISKAQTTNLAVVAPGIAEALLATALGLVAAIPAVVIYNHFARQIAAYKALVGDSSAAVLRLVSRDLSRYTVSGQKPGSED